MCGILLSSSGCVAVIHNKPKDNNEWIQYDDCVVIAVGHIRIYSHGGESHDGERKGRWESLSAKGQKMTYTDRQSQAVYKYVIGFRRLLSQGMGGRNSGPLISQSNAIQQALLVGPSVHTTTAAHEAVDGTTMKNRQAISIKIAHYSCAWEQSCKFDNCEGLLLLQGLETYFYIL
jgi:hypothetical protein